MFLTQEKALRKIAQERERGDLNRARQRALEALEKWPDDCDLAIEAAQACIDLSDYPQAANILKNAHKRHGDRRGEIMEFARSAFGRSYSILIGSFIIETLLRGRDLEGIINLLEGSPESFIADLLKRSETKARNLADEGQTKPTLAGENDLLLGLLSYHGKQLDKAVTSLGRALENLPDDAQQIGAILMRIEQELPDNALAKFYLGYVSALLSHPDKAEARFFQCLELPNPPVEKILATLESMREPSPNALLLRGDVLIRTGRHGEGIAAVREFLGGHAAPEEAAGGQGAAPGPSPDRLVLAERRLSALSPEMLSVPDVMFLYCDIAAQCGADKRVIEVLQTSMARAPENVPRVIEWLERTESVAGTAPGRHLLARAYIDSGNTEQTIISVRLASDMDPSILPGIIDAIRTKVEGTTDGDPRLTALLSELHARAGDRESAEELLGGLRRTMALPEEEIAALSGQIMNRCGVVLTGVVSMLDTSLRRGRVADAFPYVLSLCREHREEHDDLARAIHDLASEHEEYWGAVAQLADTLAKEETLSTPMRFLQATAHLFNGGVERAVFEFDQLLMLNGDLRSRVIDMYENAGKRYDRNATLHLALYHLYLEEESLAEAAHHLCRTLELDPKQIRDVFIRFEKLVERAPDNLNVWEEMLKSSLAIHHTNLAKEILKRAIAALPAEHAATLHLYGARLSAADGRWEESLRCIALALTSPQTNLRAVEEEIRGVLAREPGNPQAYFLLGETLLKMGDEAAGVVGFRRCLELSSAFCPAVREKLEQLLPLSGEPWLISSILGEIAWADGNRDEAFQYFAAAQKGPRESLAELGRSLERITTSATDDLRLALLYARNLALERRYSDAVTALERLVTEDPTITRTATDVLIGILSEEPAQLEANRLLARICICSGDAAKALEPLVRLMSDSRADPAKLDAIAAEFLPLYEENSVFLTAYATLKARGGNLEEALARYRKAFDLDAGSWYTILEAVRPYAWPPELHDTERLLAADCLLAGGKTEKLFEILNECATHDADTVAEIVRRLTQLIERAPDARYFSLGASLLAGAGQIEQAESLIARGCSVLDGEASLDLRIELGEMLCRAGAPERGERIFADILGTVTNRPDALRRIERTHAQGNDRERAALAARLAAGTISEKETARLVTLALDRNRPEDALEALSRSRLHGAARNVLLGRAYLSMGRPALALAALGSTDRTTGPDEETRCESLYLAGLAGEMLGDFGRAAAAFSAITSLNGAYADSRERALKNYTRFLEIRCADQPIVLEKTDSLECERTEDKP